eukprot:Gb_00339 [translate_table: standard]
MGTMCDSKPHAVMVPLPGQGHINPMMHLAKKLVHEDGFVVTFVNRDDIHSRISDANYNKHKSPLSQLEKTEAENIRLVSISDGLDPQDRDQMDFREWATSMENGMKPSLHKLIEELNEREEHKVTCLIVDVNIACWALDLAKQYHIPSAAIWPASTATYATVYNIPNLVSSGLLPSNGVFKEQKIIDYNIPSMPPIPSTQLAWSTIGGEETRDRVYPVGPLIPAQFLNGNISQRNTGFITTGFWAEEVHCLDWLDKQSNESVVYVSFGSVAMLNGRQFEEFALGLEATQRPFLWVVRNDLMDGTTAVFPSGFTERIKDRGCLISWAPQLSVLSHPSIACFVTHCGWNSTLESISMGVPMICWPYFADQFLDAIYIADIWKIGLALNANEDGLIDKDKIAAAVEKLLSEEEGRKIKKRVTKLKKSARDAVKEGGSSSINYKSFVNAMKNNS